MVTKKQFNFGETLFFFFSSQDKLQARERRFGMGDELTFWRLGVRSDRNFGDTGCDQIGKQAQDAESETKEIGQDDSQDPQQLLVLRFFRHIFRGGVRASIAGSICRRGRQLNEKYIKTPHHQPNRGRSRQRDQTRTAEDHLH
jgi:hypothetical protein